MDLREFRSCFGLDNVIKSLPFKLEENTITDHGLRPGVKGAKPEVK